eukprot:TRINITY_DN12922_c0_g1_i1.p1 TRINITY_DN12922_c0_g1~~TRINITY_DN12922_c0_g1_i1.p1  ORF type:complete len:479 (+),score=93.24 TRINITY_DN12922_c0_g1_i1:57-1439(+)
MVLAGRRSWLLVAVVACAVGALVLGHLSVQAASRGRIQKPWRINQGGPKSGGGDQGIPRGRHPARSAVHRAERAKDAAEVTAAPVGVASPVRSAGPHPRATQATFAHVCVVSTEDYVDGALVLGWSLAHHSSGFRNGTTDLVTVLTRGAVKADSRSRLRQAGWSQVIEVTGLAPRVPKSMWVNSFDKLYIFNLTQYSKIAFWDTDMLIRHDPDGLFNLRLPDETWVYAIGSPPKPPAPPYFQTGMMVFQPAKQVREAIWGRFSRETPPRKANGIYNRWSARDGALLRTYFNDRFKSLPKKYSRNMDPRARLTNEVGLHYRGSWKPWFQRTRQLEQRPNAPEESHKDFGYPYLEWWAAYEAMHAGLWSKEVWHDSPADVSPKTHVWMQRHTRWSYYQRTAASDRHVRNQTLPGLRLVLGEVGDSCDDVCARRKRQCSAEALPTDPRTFTPFSSALLDARRL